MELTGVSQYSGFCILGGSSLSEETRKKLLELGIDPSTVSSEAQAQALIASVKAKLEVQIITEQNGCSSELELGTRAKALARKLGISIPASNNMKQIMRSLEQAVNDKKEHQDEYYSLKKDAEQIEQSQHSIFTAMNVTANMNKIMLGLN